MAHGVTATLPVRLHQALHGYADGHRLLASSMSLKAREAKTILTLSDASGSLSSIETSGYLTGYALPEAGLYAFAKTWPAPEMPRPGCVWTHTLLVDFTDLATIADLALLVGAFRRPSPSVPLSQAYADDIVLQATEPVAPLGLAPGAEHVLRRLLWALYARPRERVISTESTTDSRESLVIALWSQQWPRLRRSFRFCTLVLSDRSTETAPFDLQFAPPNDRALRSRFSKLLDADREPSDAPPWLEDALRDLLDGPAGGVRWFLRELGAELDGAREIFGPLCELYRLVGHGGTSLDSVGAAIALLDGPLSAAAARDVRAELVSRVVRHAPEMDRPALDFAVHNLRLLPDDDRSSAEPLLGERLWLLDPASAGELLEDGDEEERRVAARGVAATPAGALLAGLRRRPSLSERVLRERPTLLSEADLWRSDDAVTEAALKVVLREPERVSVALDAMIDAGNEALVPHVCRTADLEHVLSTLLKRLDSRCAERPSREELPWFVASATPNGIAKALSDGRARQATTLIALMSQVGPDDVPNDFGEDPWFSAVRQAAGPPPDHSRLFFQAWLVARGLGLRSRNPAGLFLTGFQGVYLAALGSRLPDDAWRLLDGKLPNSYFWANWDRGRRLRAGICGAFIDRDLNPEAFGRLLETDDLFSELASEAGWMLWGRGYLRRVKRALQDVDSVRFASRIAMLNRLV